MYEIVIFMVIGIAFFIYSLFCCKKKKVIYTVIEPEFVVLDDRYFNLQLKASIINSITLIIGAILSQTPQLGKIKSLSLPFAILIFWIVNLSLRTIAINKKYAKIDR